MSTTDEQLLPGDLPLWELAGWSERFGVVAGITGRGPGPEPFDLGLWGSAPVGQVMGRWRRLLGHFPDFPAATLAHQVHGNRVLWHPAPPEPGWTLIEGADGHATQSPGRLLLVTVADCVPVYLVAPRQRAVALLHAGWRGTAAGILTEGVRLLAEHTGATPAELVGHAGVAISGPCYEVGAEVMTGVGRPAEGAGPWHLDIRSVLKEQAEVIGIKEFTTSTRCTSRDSALFFSHRGSGGKDGRMVAYIGMPDDK